MKTNKKNILLKGYLVCSILLVIALCIAYKLLFLQSNPEAREELKLFTERTNFREAIIPAERGNLYASDGSLLATSVRLYNIAIDGKSMNQSLIDKDLTSLCDSLHKLLGKPSNYYAKKILNAKIKNKQYVRIANGLNYRELKRLKAFPIFKAGQIKGGLVIEDKLVREKSVKDIGSRTLGYVKDSIKIGLEGAYNSLLAGKNGKRLEQKMGGGNWKPIDVTTEVNAEKGYDVVTTIDIPLQNVAYNALLEALQKFEAKFGTVVVMEVATGEVKAIANLTLLDDGKTYADIQNFAVGRANEPGSTIKTASLLATLKTGVADTSTLVNTGNGSTYLFGRRISDSNGYGTINVRQILEKSSNIGTAKLITSHFQKDPEDFMDIITKEWRLGEKLNVDIPGEAEPYFPNPNNKSWSKQSLSSVSFGYETKLTPLQILTFYNGIANNGVMLKPLFVKEISKNGVVIEKYTPEVRVAKMAQDSTIQKIQNMLASVVKKGTGKRLYNKSYPAAGKTGTTRAGYWKGGETQYRGSFCGYFPVDKPKYSCIAVVYQPNKKIGFYGGTVAGPIFEKIMNHVYVNTPKKLKNNIQPQKHNHIRQASTLKIEKNIPNLIGIEGYKAISALENVGLKVSYNGIGKVKSQSLPKGTSIKKGQKIHLELSI